MCPSRRQHRSLANNKELADSEAVTRKGVPALALVQSRKILAPAKGI